MSRHKSNGNGRDTSVLTAPPSTLPTDHPKYEIFREIGRGATSTIYEAYDLESKRHVAIKQFHASFRDDEQHANEFWAEAEFLAHHAHDHRVAIYGVDRTRGWIVMELMKSSLGDEIAEGPMKPGAVKEVLVQALNALDSLHQLGKLQGRVSPDSLLVDQNGCIKLSSSPGFCLGGELRKPMPNDSHVAPEVLEPTVFGNPGPAVDLYCLGTTAIELLTGPEFSRLCKGTGATGDSSAFAWLRWHRSEQETFPPIATIVPRMPVELAHVIDHLVKKRVAERYSTAQEALDDLETRPTPARSHSSLRNSKTKTHGSKSGFPLWWQIVAARPKLLAAGLGVLLLLLLSLVRPSIPILQAPPAKAELTIIVEEPSLQATCSIEPILDRWSTYPPKWPAKYSEGFMILKRQTPITLPVGKYRVKLEKEFFRPQERDFTVTGIEDRLRFDLIQELYETRLRIENQDGIPLHDARIRIDGKSSQYGPGQPLTLRIGQPQTLQVEAAGYESQTITIKGPTEETAKGLRIVMNPAPLPIVLITEPAEAHLTLNGDRLEGRSPHRASVPPGLHVVELGSTSDRFGSLREEFTLHPQSTNREFRFQLPAKDCELQIITSPLDAIVIVDDETLSGPPFVLRRPPGSVRIRVESAAEEYRPEERIVNVTYGAEPEEFVLQEIYLAAVSFHSEPRAAMVYGVLPDEGAKLLGTTPFEGRLSPGYHTLRIEFRGEVLATSRIHVSENGGYFFYDLQTALRRRTAVANEDRSAGQNGTASSLVHGPQSP